MARLVFPCCRSECAGHLQKAWLGVVSWKVQSSCTQPHAEANDVPCWLHPPSSLLSFQLLMKHVFFSAHFPILGDGWVLRAWFTMFRGGGCHVLTMFRPEMAIQTSKLISYVVEGSQRTFSQDLDLSCAQILLLVIRGCPIYMVISHSKCFKIMVSKSPKRSFKYDTL